MDLFLYLITLHRLHVYSALMLHLVYFYHRFAGHFEIRAKESLPILLIIRFSQNLLSSLILPHECQNSSLFWKQRIPQQFELRYAASGSFKGLDSFIAREYLYLFNFPVICVSTMCYIFLYGFWVRLILCITSPIPDQVTLQWDFGLAIVMLEWLKASRDVEMRWVCLIAHDKHMNVGGVGTRWNV